MSRRLVSLIVLAIGLITATLGLLRGRQSVSPVTNSADTNVVGRLEVQGYANLGSVLIGTINTASIKITNRSEDNVVINKFKPDCSCTEVYHEREGSKVGFTELLLRPNQTEFVRIDLKISGEPGLKQVSSLRFQEADRDISYEPKILFTPIARFYTVPRIAQFGDIRVDEASTKRIELRSDGSYRQGFANFSMSPSAIFSMRFTAATKADRDSDTLKDQDLLGFIDLTCDPQGKEGNIREELTFFEAGGVLGKVTATANAITDVSISPTILVLPRFEGGKPVYTGWLYCRSRSDKPFEIVSDVAPPEIKVSIDRSDAPSTSSYKIGLSFVGTLPTSSTKKLDLIFKVKNESGERSLAGRVIIGPCDE